MIFILQNVPTLTTTQQDMSMISIWQKIKRPFSTTLDELVAPFFGIHFLSHWEILNLSNIFENSLNKNFSWFMNN